MQNCIDYPTKMCKVKTWTQNKLKKIQRIQLDIKKQQKYKEERFFKVFVG